MAYLGFGGGMGNLTGIGYTPGNVDLATQEAVLERKRQMMQAALLQSMQQQPTQMAGPIAIPQGPLVGLGRALTGILANRGMGGIDAQERDLIANQQQKSAQAVQDLMTATLPQPGTPTTVTEAAGPMPDGQSPNLVTQQGIPPSFNVGNFGQAYSKAQYAGVDPQVLGAALQQFNRGRMLTQMGFGNFVPGAQQGGSSFTPSTAEHGAQLTMPTGFAGAPQGQGGSGFGGVPAQAAAMLISGDPALEKLGTTMAEFAKPISGRAGAPMWGMRPDGSYGMVGFSPSVEKGQAVDAQGRVSTAPGFVQSAKEVLGATSEAQAAGSGRGAAPYELVTVHLSDGSTAQVPKSALLPTFNGGAGPGSSGTPAGNPTANGPASPPSFAPQNANEQAALNAVRAAGNRPATFAATPGGPTPLPTGAAPASAPPGAPAGPTFNQSPSAQQQAFMATRGADLGKQFQTYADAGDAAQITHTTVKQMLDALDGFNPNAGAPARQKLAEVVQAIPGLNLTADSPVVKGILNGDLSAQQEFAKLAYGNSASSLRTLLPGQRLTQMEILQNYINSPNPSLQKAAIRTMLQMQDGMATWADDRAAAAANYQGNPAQFSSAWNRSHPMTGNRIDPATGQDTGVPYVPTLAQVKAQMDAAAKGAPQQGGAQPAPQTTKVLNGVTYVNMNGQWYRQ